MHTEEESGVYPRRGYARALAARRPSSMIISSIIVVITGVSSRFISVIVIMSISISLIIVSNSSKRHSRRSPSPSRGGARGRTAGCRCCDPRIDV